LYWQLIEIKPGAAKLESKLQINQRIFYYLLGEFSKEPPLLGIVNPLPHALTNCEILPPWHQKIVS
jgi:hypothetical protein